MVLNVWALGGYLVVLSVGSWGLLGAACVVAFARWFVGLLWVALGIRFYFPCVYCDDLF